MRHLHRISLGLTTFAIIACGACSSNSDIATDRSGVDIGNLADGGDAGGEGVAPTEACAAYIRCTSETNPSELGVIVDAYGDYGSCWRQSDTSVCSQGCLVGLRQSRVAFPDELACTTCFSDAQCMWPGRPSCDTTAGLCVPCSGGAGTCGTGNPPLPDAKYVFVTSKTFDSNLGGLDGADAKCQELAANAKRPLPGTYRAWLSIDTYYSGTEKPNPLARFPHGDLPYVRTDGIVIARSWDDLTNGLDAAIDWDENGNHLEPGLYSYNSAVWSNTNPNGTSHTPDSPYVNSDCYGWKTSDAGPNASSASGSYATKGSGWTYTYGSRQSCSYPERLYCFRQ